MIFTLSVDKKSRDQFIKALDIAKKLDESGFSTYIVGGAVRDSLLGIPSLDVDLCTACDSETLLDILPGAKPIGFQKYSVFTIPCEIGSIEIAHFREEISCDGRHCDVRLTDSFEKDVRRRDFSVNALAVNPTDMEIIDLVGGIADLYSRTIRAIGDPVTRYTEDKLRLLRAIRFATKLDFSLSEKDSSAIEELTDQVSVLSSDRIRRELEGIIVSGHPGRGFRLLLKYGLWQNIFTNNYNFIEDSRLERRLSVMDRASSIVDIYGMWAITLMPLDFNLESGKLLRNKLDKLNFTKKNRQEIYDISMGVKKIFQLKKISKAEAVALVDSNKLNTIRQIAHLLAPNIPFEIELARLFPKIGTQPFLMGKELADSILQVKPANLPKILLSLRYAELTGLIDSKYKAREFLNNINSQ
ncbi:CCA tRNA nucleotidyltransferase [bacterium]|nr:CCA tRNA nucleotidyltransferase [bacterium]